MNFRDELREEKLEIPYSGNMDNYTRPLTLYGKKISNRIGIQPLEGFDSEKDGSPSEYVYRRYLRFAAGGAGIVWFEACAVSEDGKSNPFQMMLHDGNVREFSELINAMNRKSAEAGQTPSFKVLQLTHSGRMSRDDDWNPIPLSPKRNGDNDRAVTASDKRIKEMINEHIHAAELAAAAGFDAVDVKVCHGYFLSELLSAYHRECRWCIFYVHRSYGLC